MELRREEKTKTPQPGAEPKPRRFRIVKLEERIAPNRGGHGSNNTCAGYTCVTCATCICGRYSALNCY
jgi:hypothetical protein